MKKLFLCLSVLILLFFPNCNKVRDVILSINVDIAYTDNMGNDLLNPSTPNYYSPANIHVFNVVKGVKTEVNYPSAAAPHNFIIYKNNELNQYFLRVFLETDTVFLQLNDNTTDTLTSQRKTSGASVWLTKVSYNGTVKWEFGVLETFTIVK